MVNFPEDHPYMELFRNQKAVICCGQGDWEQPDTTWYLKRIFEAKHIPIWVDLWGHDVNHDWNWWYQQVAYYMPYILGERPRRGMSGKYSVSKERGINKTP